MRQLKVFIKKEFMELYRGGKLLLLVILFVLFGIMNPAIAKLTPWLMETMADSLKDSGLTVTKVTVNALTSWTQFYKNVPIVLIVFLLLFSGIFTAEYQKGTLINIITKGMKRWKIVAAKVLVMEVLWTVLYWLCFGITYGYNAYFWDNRIAAHPVYAAGCFYLLGMWLISAASLMSVMLKNSSGVMMATGGVFLVTYLLGFLPDVKRYVPAQLASSANLLTEAGKATDYGAAAIVAVVLTALSVIFAVIIFNRRSLC